MLLTRFDSYLPRRRRDTENDDKQPFSALRRLVGALDLKVKGPNVNEMREQVRNYIVENFLFGDDEGLEDSTSFLESGMLDSTGILEVIGFLEEQFDIKVNDDELVPENLDSICNIVGFLGVKVAACG